VDESLTERPMPELPEVETVVRELRPRLSGQEILDVEVDWPRTIAEPEEDIARFCAGQRGLRIARVARRAKYVILELVDPAAGGASRGVCLIHLRMSGRLLLEPLGRPEHLRATWHLANRSTLYFYNMRKFGRLWLTTDPDQVLGDLGPEPLAEAFTARALQDRIGQRRGMLKPLLLNQRFLAGLGNIYVDESLFRAGLHPMRKADTLDHEDILRLHTAIQTTLRQAITHHGTTFDGVFVRPSGEKGRQQEGLQVYGQTGLPCTNCGTPIERIVVGQRGTHICPVCQPLRSTLTEGQAGRQDAFHQEE
jgi:formamidopyrimidine-DNA glycosylase